MVTRCRPAPTGDVLHRDPAQPELRHLGQRGVEDARLGLVGPFAQAVSGEGAGEQRFGIEAHDAAHPIDTPL
jgi:hypothetical protein